MKISDASCEERMGFVQKVYGIVGAQVGVTAVMCFLAMNSPAFLSVMLQPAMFVVSLIGLVVITCLFTCSKDMRSTVPRNYILLLLFTIFEGHSVAILCAAYDRDIVALALILTAGVFLVMTGHAITAKRDYTISWRIFLTLAIAGLFLGIVRIFYRSEGTELLASFLGILSGCFYVLYDTQMLFGGSARSFDLDDYILAALNIYLDIVILFVKLLKFLSKLKEEKKKE